MSIGKSKQIEQKSESLKPPVEKRDAEAWNSLWANRVLACYRDQFPVHPSWSEELLPTPTSAEGLLLRFVGLIFPAWIREQIKPDQVLPGIQTWLHGRIHSPVLERGQGSIPLAYALHYLLSPSVIPGWYEWEVAPWEQDLVSQLYAEKILQSQERALWLRRACRRHLTRVPDLPSWDAQAPLTPRPATTAISVGLFPPALYPLMQRVWERGYATELEGTALLCRVLRYAGIPARVLQAYGPWKGVRSWVEFWDGRNWCSLEWDSQDGCNHGSHRIWGRKALFISVDLEIPLYLYSSFPLKDFPQLRGERGIALERTRQYTQTTILQFYIADEAGNPLRRQSLKLAVGTPEGLRVFAELESDEKGGARIEVGLGWVAILWAGHRLWVDTKRTQKIHLQPQVCEAIEVGELPLSIPMLLYEEPKAGGERGFSQPLERGNTRYEKFFDRMLREETEDPLLHQPQIQTLVEAVGHREEWMRIFFAESETGYDLANRIQWLMHFDGSALAVLGPEVLEESIFSDPKRPLYRKMTGVEVDALWGQAFANTLPTAWRSALRRLLEADGLQIPEDSDGVVSLLREQFSCTGEGGPDCQLPPELCYRMGRAEGGLDRGAWERLAIALFRLAGIPARQNPWTQMLEWFDEDVGRFRILAEEEIWFPGRSYGKREEEFGFHLEELVGGPVEGDMERLLREKREEAEAKFRVRDPKPLEEYRLEDCFTLRIPNHRGSMALAFWAQDRWIDLPVLWKPGVKYSLSQGGYLLRRIEGRQCTEQVFFDPMLLKAALEQDIKDALKQSVKEEGRNDDGSK